MILPYFTTNDMTPEQVQNVGREQLAMLYPLVGTMLLLFLSRPPLTRKRMAHPRVGGGCPHKKDRGYRRTF